jgi:hypothetical protein
MYQEDGFMSSSYDEFVQDHYPKPVPVEAWDFVTSFFLFTPDGQEMISRTVFDRLEGLILQSFTGSLASKTADQKKRLRIEYEKGVEKRYKKYSEATLRGSPQSQPSEVTLKANRIELNTSEHSVGKCSDMENGEATKPGTWPPLRAAVPSKCKAPEKAAIWKRYAKKLEGYLEAGLARDKMIAALAFFWPAEISKPDREKLAELIADFNEVDLEMILNDLQQNLEAIKAGALTNILEFVNPEA